MSDAFEYFVRLHDAQPSKATLISHPSTARLEDRQQVELAPQDLLSVHAQPPAENRVIDRPEVDAEDQVTVGVKLRQRRVMAHQSGAYAISDDEQRCGGPMVSAARAVLLYTSPEL